MVSLWYTIYPQKGLEKSACKTAADVETSIFSSILWYKHNQRWWVIPFYIHPTIIPSPKKITVETDAPPSPPPRGVGDTDIANTKLYMWSDILMH